MTERGGQVSFSHTVESFEDHGDHVSVFADTPHGRERFTSKWLVGTDGARSVVRSGLGLSFLGKTYEDRFLLVATDLRLGSIFKGMGPVAYIFDPKEWVIVMHLPDVVRLVFRLDPDEDALFTVMTSPLARTKRYSLDAKCHLTGAHRAREGRSVAIAGDGSWSRRRGPRGSAATRRL